MAHLTALEQQREDQALGAAWRRCEAALPEGQIIGLVAPWANAKYVAISSVSGFVTGEGDSPTAALEALAEALEARRAADSA